ALKTPPAQPSLAMPPRATGPALLLVSALVAGGALAAVAATYVTPSTLQVTVGQPPVRLEVGAGGQNGRYFSPALEPSANRTIVAGTLKPPAGADATVKDVLRIVETTGTPRVVTLRGAMASSASVEVFTWTVADGGATLATLDLRQSDPSATFTLPAGATVQTTVRVDLAEGAGRHNAPGSFTLWLVVG
ncbi:MAG TPA: hypothetical protein VNX21_06310, partial [Candidatus Thermoplasmatota archaeon]|nr:hypothetical protein [Candidatus Thermoplasmatota archaeon]